RHEPSLMAIRTITPSSISTTGSFTAPASKHRAAPWVRLTRPEATAASWSARSSGNRLDEVNNNPSAETTTACATPGTRSAKSLTSQPNWYCCGCDASGEIIHPPCARGCSCHRQGVHPWAGETGDAPAEPPAGNCSAYRGPCRHPVRHAGPEPPVIVRHSPATVSLPYDDVAART